VIRSKKLRDSARGQECTLQIAGICCGDTETTVLAHLPDESHGMGLKADDISSCYACRTCHDAIDMRSGWARMNDDSTREWYMRRAMVRTWRRMIDSGLVVVK
jgi:hypothetical protein